MNKKIFITGTGTDVGKTYVAGLIVKKLCNAGVKNAYYKCAMSGNVRDDAGELSPGDAAWVKRVSGIEQSLSSMCPYIYETAVSPHLASRLENGPIEFSKIKLGYETLCREYDYTTLEGSGGIICPLRYDEVKFGLVDIVREFGLSCLIVADAGLGVINSCVLTVEYMRMKKIPISGIIFNRFHPGNVMEEDNLRMCEELTGVKVVACVREGDCELDMDVETLKSLYRL